MPVDTNTSGLISYQEAAALLGRKEQTIRKIVLLGHLHPIPDPRDKRRRLLSRKEVEAYAVNFVRRALPSQGLMLAPDVPGAAPGNALDISPQMLGAVAGGVALALLLIFMLKEVGDPAMRVIIMGAIVGIALLVLTEWQEQGRISATQRRRLERLAQNAETDPEPFVNALEELLSASA